MAHSRPITNEIEIRFNPVVVPSNNVLFLTLLKGQQLSGWIWFRIFFRTTFRLVQWRSVTYGHRSYVWIPLGIGANCLLIKTSTDEEAGPFRFTFRVVLGPFPALLLSIQFIWVCRHVFSPLLFSFLSFFLCPFPRRSGASLFAVPYPVFSTDQFRTTAIKAASYPFFGPFIVSFVWSFGSSFFFFARSPPRPIFSNWPNPSWDLCFFYGLPFYLRNSSFSFRQHVL